MGVGRQEPERGVGGASSVVARGASCPARPLPHVALLELPKGCGDRGEKGKGTWGDTSSTRRAPSAGRACLSRTGRAPRARTDPSPLPRRPGRPAPKLPPIAVLLVQNLHLVLVLLFWRLVRCRRRDLGLGLGLGLAHDVERFEVARVPLCHLPSRTKPRQPSTRRAPPARPGEEREEGRGRTLG